MTHTGRPKCEVVQHSIYNNSWTVRQCASIFYGQCGWNRSLWAHNFSPDHYCTVSIVKSPNKISYCLYSVACNANKVITSLTHHFYKIRVVTKFCATMKFGIYKCRVYIYALSILYAETQYFTVIIIIYSSLNKLLYMLELIIHCIYM